MCVVRVVGLALDVPVVLCPWMEVSLGHVVVCALGCPVVELAFPSLEETGKGWNSSDCSPNPSLVK